MFGDISEVALNCSLAVLSVAFCPLSLKPGIVLNYLEAKQTWQWLSEITNTEKNEEINESLLPALTDAETSAVYKDWIGPLLIEEVMV